ncbi:unnamed protein product [Chondrus crispus]|uniref:Uncharacterized protein n=1 Tax=Chondrus crispus TaxID=2769 RepID=R7QSF2_CHOCR|nr:unnamed protein product [Chondrus crispus]CDF41039.1 unnamed protein product [Chondrus crispus]|eukprot:XP_005711333.1 unnamed protein product [Chondrus crispus]
MCLRYSACGRGAPDGSSGCDCLQCMRTTTPLAPRQRVHGRRRGAALHVRASTRARYAPALVRACV